MYNLNDYHYDLPPELIAQRPVARRDRSKLLCMERRTGTLKHSFFFKLGDYFEPGDVLVLNNAAIIPGRLVGRKATGGKVEVLITDFNAARKSSNEDGSIVCRCLVKASKRSSFGAWYHFDNDLKAEVLQADNGSCQLKFYSEEDFETVLNRIGQVPLPPYIKRDSKKNIGFDDKTSYQTVYASQIGAIAAPTAGLHFTVDLLDQLRETGVRVVELTLHVGYGTFQPVRTADIRRHKMHTEPFSISAGVAETINAARADGKRVVAVGTTCVRTLEYASNTNGEVEAGSGDCDLFIFPGYRFKAVDAMITNFHLPESTLLMLVSAFAGRQNVLNAYQEAVREQYRFFSYGDAMLIH
jgi:S-adenosylmethionine:tRNA ribosyltransferase-isomerase